MDCCFSEAVGQLEPGAIFCARSCEMWMTTKRSGASRPRFPSSSMLLSTVAIVSCAFLPNAFAISTRNTSSPQHGAVTTEVAQCSQIGVDIMKQGGNAVDATIASSLCVGVISAYHSGIGGGGFMIVRFNQPDGSRGYETIDFRETAPAAGNQTMYTSSSQKSASTIGGLAVGVPGELRGWEMLHQRHGSLPWKTLFLPAIRVARGGFKVNQDLASELDARSFPFLLKDPLWAEVYAPNGTVLKQGATCYRKRLANTLEQQVHFSFRGLAEQGAGAFYSGSIANNIVKATTARGGILAANDLTSYQAIVRIPNNITYRNFRIFSTVAPSSGSVVLSTLKVFEGYNSSATDTDPKFDVTLHRLIQATKFGYGQRNNYGDPAFTSNVTQLEQSVQIFFFFTLEITLHSRCREYIQESTAEQIRKLISDNATHTPSYYNPSNYTVSSNHGTSHVAAMDLNGMAVSLTTTVNLIWGSQVMTQDGIVLNGPGQSNAFGFAASPINFIQPSKRPQSSIASTLVEDLQTGQLIMATGAAGGSRIITATLQNLHYHLDVGLNAYDTVHHGRFHDQLGASTLIEDARPDISVAGIKNRTGSFLRSIGSFQALDMLLTDFAFMAVIIRNQNGTFDAASDPRRPAGGAAVF
ncbi:hypothetical protein D9758_013875 [Tetrapyrgos nigripes]|uniref:Glutathione hydrolase n=1 Tax=Tetrapyrgos nigripes TaxID=182062 RepID=A0A8H5FR24_9AGAR|nr:hypothetical protein D9758_013875 [Tetrapyrgos nigripes]